MTNLAASPPQSKIAQKLALALMRRFVRRGRLRMHIPGGEIVDIGGGDSEMKAAMTLPRLFSLVRMFAAPDPLFLSGYVDGEWDCPEGELENLLVLLSANAADKKTPGIFIRRAVDAALWLRFRLRQFNPRSAARRRVAHHYDLGDELYLRFLDKKHAQYSCAFFDGAHPDLESAQQNKIDITIARLRMEEEKEEENGAFAVLDIGGGWGGLTREIIRRHPQARVCGITLSRRQFRYAESARDEMPDESARARLRYELADYREHRGAYRRIVSVGMFEHVGLPQYGAFFQSINRLLTPGGVAVLHTIVRPQAGICSPWLDKNIFPGGYIPAVSQVAAAAENSGLLIDAAYFHSGENYQKTLRAWRKNYRAARAELSADKYDRKFHRMWEMYFGAAIHTFDPRQDAYRVVQFVFKKRRELR